MYIVGTPLPPLLKGVGLSKNFVTWSVADFLVEKGGGASLKAGIGLEMVG